MFMSHERESDDLNQIYAILYRLGLSANYAGFFQLACAVRLVREKPERLLMVTKWLYPEIAKQYHTSCCAVERNLRTAVAVIWKENTQFLQELVGSPLPPKYGNGKFLSLLAAYASEGGAA